jgi:anti-sigma B factor antagonist
MLEISSQELRRCDVVRAKGRVDSASVGELKTAFDEITEAGRFKIVLNLSETSFMSSAGLRQLIETMKTCKRFNRGDLVLAELPQNISDVLALAGLNAVFKVYGTEVEAVGSF